jgi:hypothetical protein
LPGHADAAQQVGFVVRNSVDLHAATEKMMETGVAGR